MFKKRRAYRKINMSSKGLELFDLNFDSIDLVGGGVLVVEDEPLMKEVFYKTVSQLANRWVVCAEDGLTAYQTLLHNLGRIDIVICDIEIPTFDGLELLRLTRKHDELRHIKFIMISNFDSHDNRASANTLGASAFISKRVIEKPDYISKALNRAIKSIS